VSTIRKRTERFRAVTPRPAELEAELVALVRSSPLLMRALCAAREANPPDWLIGAGVIRDHVWSRLHGIAPPQPRDVDLAFYDPDALGEAQEEAVLHQVRERAPELPWEVTNEARVHLWYPRVHGVDVAPLRSTEEAVASWPETATAVAVRLTADDRIEVVAPHGLQDLFELVWRHNPRRAPGALFRQRLHDKRIAERWPRVRIVDPTPA
jgi:uncharacterized protein